MGRCSGHVSLGRGPREDPGHARETMSPDWAGMPLDLPEELEEEGGYGEVWTSLLRLSSQPGPGWAEHDRWMDVKPEHLVDSFDLQNILF